MKNKRLIALLLALTCFALAGCRRQAKHTEPVSDEADADVVGDDWRTWGWINDWGIIEMDDGEQITLLLCVFTENAVLFYDDATQTEFADLLYPYEIPDAEETFESFSLLDQNGDGSSDVKLLFLHDDGTQTELFWCWNGEAFVFAPELGGEGPAEYTRSEEGWEYVP